MPGEATGASVLDTVGEGDTRQVAAVKEGSDRVYQVLGQNNGVQALHGAAEIRAACAAMVGQGRRTVKIYSSDLEPAIYDTAEFLDRARQLALSGPHASLRVIVQDEEPAIKRGHRFLALARSLPSYIEIRRAHEDYKDQPQVFLLVDAVGYVRRPLSSAWEAEANFADRLQAAGLQRFFDQVWELSLVTPDLRRLDL